MADNETLKLKKRLSRLFALLFVSKGLIIGVSFFPVVYKSITGKAIPVMASLRDTSTVAGVLFAICLNIVAVAVPALIWLAANSRKDDFVAIPNRKPKALEILCGAALTQTAGYVTSAIFVILGTVISKIFGNGTESIRYDFPQGATGFILLVVYLAVCPALFEELMFRGAFLGGTRKWGNGFAIAITSIAFSMMHNTLSQLPFALVTGLCIGYLVIRFDSIYIGIISHFFVNFNAAVVSYLFADFFKQSTSINVKEDVFTIINAKSLVGMGYVMLLFVFLLIFTILFFVEYKIKPVTSEKSEANKMKALFTCPEFYAFAAEFVFIVVWNIIALFK